MVAETIKSVIQRYLQAVNASGIHARRAILFGSYARGEAGEWSDIDLVIIAPELDDLQDRKLISKLWALRAVTDSRIEPIACGEKEWDGPASRPIIEIARQEGIEIEA